MSYSPSTPFSEYFLGEQRKYPELKMDDIQKLKDSLEDDERLPYISDKRYLAFLHSCFFDVEQAKKTIQKYYKFHYDIPQVFCELDPLSEEIEKLYNCVSVGQLPVSNDDKTDRLIYMQFKDYNHEMFDFVVLYRYLFMWLNYSLLTYGTSEGIIAVIDSKGLSWRHIVKLPVVISTKMLKFLETGLPVRINQIHILNTGTATQMILKFIQKIANQELMEKIKVYAAGSEDVFKYVPRKIMPVEIGGLGCTHNQLNDELYNNIIDIRDVFLEENEIINNQMNYLNSRQIEDDE